MCHGDCSWDTATSTCTRKDSTKVTPIPQKRCGGGRKAPNCPKCVADAPAGKEAEWCQGDCEWHTESSICLRISEVEETTDDPTGTPIGNYSGL